MVETHSRANTPLDSCCRIWFGSVEQPHSTRMFRKTFDSGVVEQAILHLFADSRYQVWVNNVFVARGPAAFHPHRLPVAAYDVTDLLQVGENVIAVLVLSHGVALHTYIPAGRPGLVACLAIQSPDGTELRIQTDNTWKATDRTGWNSDVPRRSWAIGAVEKYDAAEGPDGWKEIGFDDNTWEAADDYGVLAGDGIGFYYTGLPDISCSWKPVCEIIGHWATTPAVHPVSADDHERDYAEALMAEAWYEPQSILTGTLDHEGGGITISGLKADQGTVLCFDLGREYCGIPTFSLVTDSEGVIDFGWSERLAGNRPCVNQKGASYADRFLALKGRQQWQPIQFTAGRYFYMAFRRFSGAIQVQRLGMLATEPDLDWSGRFSSSDDKLNRIWWLCSRSQRVGTQEIMTDCPSREQALYLGDGAHTGLWIGRLTGDYGHYRYLLREAFAVQAEDGLVRSSVFSGRPSTLIDYPLIAVWSTERYIEDTGDKDFVLGLLPAFHKLMGWYLDHFNDDGLFALDWESFDRKATWVTSPATAFDVVRNMQFNLFIDHPGMGWHNQGEPGIDRRGINAAINALLVMTMRALADVSMICNHGDPSLWHRRADALARVAADVFWNDEKQVFVDGIRKGEQLSQVSQQTNIWCIAAGLADPERSRRVLRTIMDPCNAEMARCGPYFWAYLLPLLAEYDCMTQAMDSIRMLWGSMLDRGATTLYETFAGDENDSFCHPWSGAPLDFLLRHVAGIGPCHSCATVVSLRPRPDLLRAVSASVPTRFGELSIAWEGGKITGSLPHGLTGELVLPDGSTFEVGNDWQHVYAESGVV